MLLVFVQPVHRSVRLEVTKSLANACVWPGLLLCLCFSDCRSTSMSELGCHFIFTHNGFHLLCCCAYILRRCHKLQMCCISGVVWCVEGLTLEQGGGMRMCSPLKVTSCECMYVCICVGVPIMYVYMGSTFVSQYQGCVCWCRASPSDEGGGMRAKHRQAENYRE